MSGAQPGGSSPVVAADLVIPLRRAGAADRSVVGGKAACLGLLVAAGLPVPDGFVVTTAALARVLASDGFPDDPKQIRAAPMPPDLREVLHAAASALGDGPFAVRSSGLVEDSATASFAGLYETVLDVSGPAALEDAVRLCWASALSARVRAYVPGGDPQDARAVAVLVQQLVAPDVAGVAFTANPVTGARHEVVIGAVTGRGDRLVAGERDAGEWVVRGSDAIRRRGDGGSSAALSAAQAVAVAALARRVADHFGVPQDVEWALAGEQFWVLQARPMTALPDPVEWRSPLPGGWLRHFRFGEWLPEPITPLFETWLLARLETRFAAGNRHDVGFTLRPPIHVTVNGWYFHAPLGTSPLSHLLLGMLRRPRFALASILIQSRPDVGDHIFFTPLARHWRVELLPRYQALVGAWQRRVATASEQELSRLVDELGDAAGDHLWSLTMVGGFAWKVEGALARFYRKHLRAEVGRSHQELLCGLPSTTALAQPHAVQSLDWLRPTYGEAAPAMGVPDRLATRRQEMAERRAAAEAACRAVLAGRPKLLTHWERLLALAQRYAVLREEQVASVTLAWPVLRHAAQRLGEALVARGVLGEADQILFLTRAEVEHALAGDRRDHDLGELVAARRREWEHWRRLSPPLMVGKLPGFMEAMVADAVEAMRMPATLPEDALRGMPASPGRATGAVRLVRSAADLEHFQPGEVLVSQVIAPAWTPLFARAAAVVTDSGSVAAHASLIAREYGIPAVVATGDATARLYDGQVVTVDGSAGLVEARL